MIFQFVDPSVSHMYVYIVLLINKNAPNISNIYEKKVHFIRKQKCQDLFFLGEHHAIKTDIMRYIYYHHWNFLTKT